MGPKFKPCTGFYTIFYDVFVTIESKLKQWLVGILVLEFEMH